MSKFSPSPLNKLLQTENIRLNTQLKPHIKNSSHSELQILSLIQERKKLDFKVKALQNRIKYLETERVKSTRTIELSQTLDKKRIEIRKKHSENIELSEKARKLKSKEIEKKRKEINDKRNKRTASLNQTKTKVLEEKQRTSSAMKLESKKLDDLIKSREELEKSNAKERAESVIAAARRRRERLELKKEAMKISNEMKFIERMECEGKAKHRAQIKMKRLGEGKMTQVMSKTLQSHKPEFGKLLSCNSLNSSFTDQSGISPCLQDYVPSLDSTEKFDDLLMNYIEYEPFELIDIV